jgi:hypothetical protein
MEVPNLNLKAHKIEKFNSELQEPPDELRFKLSDFPNFTALLVAA